MQQTVYIKPEKNQEVSTAEVALGQVAGVYAEDTGLKEACRKQIIFRVPEEKQEQAGHYVLSVLTLIEQLQKEHPGIAVENLGEADLIVDYQPFPKRIRAWEYVKTALVCGVVFVGAAFAIMTFNNDGDVPRVFARIYELIMGAESDGTTPLELGYSLGLPVGIIVFFNHFSGKQLTEDPTPIEVQMRLYEDDVDSTVIQNANRKEKGTDVD